jgi:ATPase family associated with various cellular activities (AAA)
MIIPERFHSKVLTHAYAVLAKRDYPLILAIEGPPGDGKSFQTAHTLREAGFEVFARSAALLAGRHESDSSENLRSLYRDAGEHAKIKRSCPAIVLDDFDLSPAGQFSTSRYTVNSQLLVAFLMNLHDNTVSCGVGTDQRFPVFLTGNNFTGVHKPLMRHGRMNIFTWKLEPEERCQIVFGLLDEHVASVSEEEARRIEKMFPGVPISFFSAAINDCFGVKVYHYATRSPVISSKGLQDFVAQAPRLTLEEVEAALTQRLANEDGERGDYSGVY